MGLSAAAMLANHVPAYAGPFENADFEKLVPLDKKLSPAWIKSLYDKGKPEVYYGDELDKIGMPVGGICSGQLYLGGDGKLWHWDIFNAPDSTGDAHYANPPLPSSPLEQGFAIKITKGKQSHIRRLDKTGFKDISFRGEYPIGMVEYKDPDSPITVSLEAFSPFIPLNTDESSLPGTILNYTISNPSNEAVDVEIAGWLQNAACLYTGSADMGYLFNSIVKEKNMLMLDCKGEPSEPSIPKDTRPKIVYESFDGNTYGDWKTEGDAFGAGPAHGPHDDSQHLSGYEGGGLVSTWTGTDALQGKLISPVFTIERNFINFLIGGGNHPHETCMNLIVDGQVMRTQTGKNSDNMEWACWNVSNLLGKPAHLEIVDHNSGDWGHIDIDQIEFDDISRVNKKMDEQYDYGTMSLALLNPKSEDEAAAVLSSTEAEAIFAPHSTNVSVKEGKTPAGDKLIGCIKRKVKIDPGKKHVATFLICWNFPKWTLAGLQDLGGRYYANRFPDSSAAARYLADNIHSLSEQTRLWRDTWYDSTLPCWFLDRTFLNASILATSTCHRLSSGRFWAWEGVGCCVGTCTHVWHYAHAVARLFPDLERDLRDRVDLGISFDSSTGVIGFRGEFDRNQAVDGQAGVILRAYREHQMSADSAFLSRIWLRLKKAFDPLFQLDDNKDGIMEGPQWNTLDAAWYGKIPWLSSLYVAALRAGEKMALEMNDPDFAEKCRQIAEKGSANIDQELWNNNYQYYIQIADPSHANAVGSYDGCEIDQVFGQSWAHQVGLGRILSKENTHTALQSLWKYNFTPDVGPYRGLHKSGRWFAMPGEGGLLMVSFPMGDAPDIKDQNGGWSAMYFNECMTGFEYEVAWNMICEGMLQEGLSVTRAIHDRYHPLRRNPWNEVECGDHYARAMASYGVFLAVCGFECHGPKRHLGFTPHMNSANFKAAFTTAEGWGSFSQKLEKNQQTETIELKWGLLNLETLSFEAPFEFNAEKTKASFNGKPLRILVKKEGNRAEVIISEGISLKEGDKLSVTLV
jgi:uncharacterized protein (DUF608 family)